MIHQENVDALRAELEMLIVGRELPGWSCCCGALKRPASRAVAVRPAGDVAEYQVDMPVLWSVSMENNWATGLTHFVPQPTVDALFAKHRPLYSERPVTPAEVLGSQAAG